MLAHIREEGSLLDPSALTASARDELLQKEAILTSKDPELSSAAHHDQAIALLSQQFNLEKPSFADSETLGIAGGIYRRRWFELGPLADLQRSASFYEGGAWAEKTKTNLGDDAYAHINAAFVHDLLAQAGDQPDKNQSSLWDS